MFDYSSSMVISQMEFIALSMFPISFLALLLSLLYVLRKEILPDVRLEEKDPGKQLKALEGPKPLPLLGSLHLLGQEEIPFAAFTKLIPKFGDIFKIRLGTTDCVVLNNVVLRDEMVKNADFDGRPDFGRFRVLFGGDKQNALAFCDYDDLQTLRRKMLSNFTFPRSFTNHWTRMDKICTDECHHMIQFLKREIEQKGDAIDLRLIILKASANIFNVYFCGALRSDYDDAEFSNYVYHFDQVFYEVNTGRLPDFVPSLLFTSAWPIYQARKSAKEVRKFILKMVNRRIMELKDLNRTNVSHVFLDDLMPFIDDKESEKMNRERALFALDDILGGFCASACITLRILVDIARHPNSQQKIHNEIHEIEGSVEELASFENAKNLHWTRASIFETLRLTCSPIVPHRANKDSSIGGYFIKKDTVVFVNNHELSMSEKYWNLGQTQLYKPERFLEASSGEMKFQRHRNFRPFSEGRRSCMGYKMVENLTVSLVVSLLSQFSISMPHNDTLKIPKGILGLSESPIKMRLKRKI